MNEEIVKELIKNADRVALVIGLTYGSLVCILERLSAQPFSEYSPYEDLSGLKKIIAANIEDIYYSEKKPEIKDEIKKIISLDTEIKDLNLTRRTINPLRGEKINTINDLIKKTKNDLLKIPNIGMKSIKEIVEILNYYGLKLKD